MTGPSRSRTPVRAALALALALVGGAGVSAGPGPRIYRVTIDHLAFGPPPSGVRVGDVIEWVNADILRHTATARNGAFDVDLAPTAHARTALRKPGEVRFYCRYHPGMTGRFVVAGPAASRPRPAR
jgi:plastocyanin